MSTDRVPISREVAHHEIGERCHPSAAAHAKRVYDLVTRREPPLRVWQYRGWCWVCRRCNPTPGTAAFASARRRRFGLHGAGQGYATRQGALDAALEHCGRGNR